MPHTLLNTEEAAEYLHVDSSTIRTLAAHGEVPCERRGDDWVFRKGELKIWASRRILGLQGKNLKDYHSKGVVHPHDLSDHSALLTELTEGVPFSPCLMARSRATVIREMVALAEGTGLLYDPADLRDELRAREDLCSTGIEGGVAILHPRFHDPYMVEDSFVCVGRSVQPIPFGAPDGGKTDLFFLACCQEDRIHLHTLARICLLCHTTDLTDRLRHSATSEDMHLVLHECEMNLL
jgi:PTS system nitrogen regulatory IIA component